MRNELKVTPEQLENQANIVRGYLNDMKGAFDSLRSLVDGSNGYWIGEAAESHRKAYMNQITAIDTMFKRYQEHIADLEKIAGIHGENERKSTEFADELPISTL